MIKNVLSSIGGVEHFGIISICLFFAFFVGAIVWAFCQKRSHLDAMSALPLHPETDPARAPTQSTNREDRHE